MLDFKKSAQNFHDEKENQTLEIPRLDLKAITAARRETLADKYGSESIETLKDFDVAELFKAEKEIAQCDSCDGLHCQKKRNQWLIPNVKFDSVCRIDIRRCPCQYSAAIEHKAKVKKLQGLSQIPPQYEGKTFDDYTVDADNQDAVEIASFLINDDNKGAYFFGNVGTGKTFLAAIMAQEIIKRGRQVLFVKLPKLSELIRATYNKQNQSGNTERDYLRPLFEVPTLILDDVGIEKPTSFICEKLNLIIDERYSSNLQTIITSNLSLEELQATLNKPVDTKNFSKVGDRVVDRLQTMCVAIELTGGSRRR